VDVEGIERQLTQMDGFGVYGNQDAYDALAHVMTAVAMINEGLPSADVVEKLKKWIERLVEKLTQIVEQLTAGTSFSITVGTGVSVTVNFPSPNS
jgi:hypothetical protein